MLSNPGIYVHVPWCVRKCPYCDFNSHPLQIDNGKAAYSQQQPQQGQPTAARQPDYGLYLQALQADWNAQQPRSENAVFSSVFIGGGTPSLCPPHIFASLLQALPLQQDAEITMEANPGTTECHNLKDFHQAGINRLSIGAQSFNDEHLQRLGRIHQAAETRRAFAAARNAGFNNINLDLMWGLPGQSLQQAMLDLDTAISLAPEHISWYQLTIEAKTEFARRTPILPVEQTLADIEQYGLEKLAAAGYQRYEVSAFAREQRTCQHNVNYWRFGDYAGIGAGAHGKYTSNGKIYRTAKASQPRLYQAGPQQTSVAEVADSSRLAEFMLNALRLVDGVPCKLLQQQTGINWQDIQPRWQPLVEQGLVQAARCATTPLGLRYLDSVVATFLES